MDTLANVRTDLDALSTSFSDRTDDDILVQDDTGTHYQSSYTYFYVPKTNPDRNSANDDAGLGAFLRLGQYSDVEQTLPNDTEIRNYYPNKYVDLEGANAPARAGGAGGAKGILLSCDGRILIRSHQEMLVETNSYHHRVSGDHELDVSDTVTVTAGKTIKKQASDGQIILKTGSGAAKDEGTNAKAIILDADGGAADLVENVKTATRNVGGNDYKVTKGATHSWTEGTTTSFYWGAQCSVSAGANFFMSMGADCFVKPFLVVSLTSFSVAATGISLGVTGFNISATERNLDLISMEMQVKGVSAETEAAAARLTQIESNIANCAVETQNIKARTSSIETSMGNVKSDLSFLIFFA
ncbi:hypothetical protein JM93_02383 [Roseibium hamelinense]|uniref:Uncharacterized protein n=1 Tax=Roseibium hamelinense TaxID=150831 RepID=A0A562T0Q3_9HYPH|nr:hypothetical protein [Roseibium hamelinense]MTI43775.1 hypothetical protein [Roseibium hamelinense]TWI87145.1 hypothetical protein JM93_02383 [Roseibium hamelinense]